MSESLSVYDIEFDALESTMMEWVKEALDLRHGAAGDPEGPLGPIPYDAGPGAMARFLVRVVARADRIDGLLAKATQARARARRAQGQAAFDADAEFDKAMKSQKSREFVSGLEKKSEAALQSFEARHTAHRAKRLVSVSEEVYEVINACHWQIDALRKDVRSLIHSVTFESSLER